VTAVTLTTVVLNDAEDPSDLLVLSRLTKLSRNPIRGGRVQRVAGGRFRAIVQAGVQETWTLTASKVSLTDQAWIEAHAGRVLCVRDDAGRKAFGVYLEVPSDDRPYPRTADLSLEIRGVTWIEALA
jgi:hypothetical protein